jgi:hypothetical protein
MKTLIITILTVAVLFAFYIKKRSFALWSADPFGECQIEELKSEDGEFFINYSVYTHKKKPSKKNMLILPPTGGKNIIDEGYALSLCRAGFKVYILEDWKNIKDYELDYKIHQVYQTRTQKAFGKMIDIIGGENIGVLGSSAGGINFAVTLGTEPVAKKISAFFSIVSGMPLCKVIANSEEKGLKGIREERFEKTDVSDMKEYEKRLCAAVDWSISKKLPEGMAYGAIISTRDVTVSTRFQLEMTENFKPTVLIKSNRSHFYTVVTSYFFYKSRIIDFFKKNT